MATSGNSEVHEARARGSSARRPPRRAPAVAAAAALMLIAFVANAQLIDSTLAEIVENEVQEQVTDQLADDLAGTIDDDVAEQVAATVAAEVEEQVASSVADDVSQEIAGQVVDAIEEQVESGIVGAVADELESGVARGIEEQLGLDVDVGVEVGELGGAAPGADGGADDDSGPAPANRPAERYVGELDAARNAAERDVWVVLVPGQYAERIESWGFSIRERRNLDSLGRVLLRVDAPEDRDIAQAALDLALDAPGTLVDFNHVYRGTADGASQTGARAAGKPAASAATALPHRLPSTPTASEPAVAPALAIGMIDSAIAPHAALAHADIVQRDFVPFDGARPTSHGTAVASILVGNSREVAGRLSGARLYAASVFFADADGNAAATTASLVAGLEWLVAHRIRVVNMSLAGPANRVLEAAIGVAAERGALVVAAVGNNGPNGAALYPAAYAPVVGVTAVDSANRVYRNANRGKQVMFAARGVKVKVARDGGGYGVETGTSMAAPYAAAAIARRAAARPTDPLAAVLAALQGAATDLGPKGYDVTFGYGLISDLD